MTPEVTSGGVMGILAGVLTLIGVAFGLWKTKSKTHASVTEDNSRIGWIGDLDARMRSMQNRMDELEIKERRTHDLHQECLRMSELQIAESRRQGAEIKMLQRLLFAVRPELRDVFGANTGPGELGSK